jgi:preprotein translocase subunit SecD
MLMVVVAGLNQPRADRVEAARIVRVFGTPQPCDWTAELPAYLYSLAVNPEGGVSPNNDDLASARTVISRRVGLLDTQEFARLAVPASRVRVSESAPIIEVALKRIDEAQEVTIERLLQEKGRLEIVDSDEQVLPTGTVVRTTLDDADAVIGSATPAGQVFESIINSADVVPTSVVYEEPITRNPVIRFQLSSDGAARLSRLYESHQGQPVAFLLDNVVIWSPRIGGTESSSVMINSLAPAQARALAIMLRSGPLPMGLEIANREELDPAVICNS